jgi:HlyD family secretion protein
MAADALRAVPAPPASSLAHDDDEPTPEPTPDPALVQALRADKRRRRRRTVAVVVVSVCVLGVVVAGIASSLRATPVTYETRAATRGSLVLSVSATGTVEPVNAVDVGADLSGRVARVLVDVNDRVERGALLAELQTDVLDLAVLQSRAAVTAAAAARGQAEVAVDDAAVAVERARTLRRSGTITPAELENAESTQRRARAALAVVDANTATARATLALAQANRSKAAIRAPIPGVVLTRNVEPGQVVISALQAAVLFRVAEDLSRLQVRANIDEADVGRVREGQPATFTVSAAPDVVYQGRVRSVTNAPRVLQQVVTYEAVLDVDNADGTLRPGMTATVRIEAGRVDDAVVVPTTALRFVPANERKPVAMRGPPKTTTETSARPVPRVWLLQAGLPVARDVVVLASDGERAAVRGIDEGAVVVVAEGTAP